MRLWAKGLYAPSEDTSTEDAEINEETVISDGFVATAPKEEKADRAGLGDLPELFYGGKLCMSGTAKEILPRLLTLIGCIVSHAGTYAGKHDQHHCLCELHTT